MEKIDKVLKDLGLEGKPTSDEASARHYAESYNCTQCNDLGVVHPRLADGKVDYSRTVECECRVELNRRLQSLKLLRMCELPAGTEGYTFENFKTRRGLGEAYGLSKKLAAGNENLKWLCLVGDVDVGKTHLAIAICRGWLLRGVLAKYAYVPLLLDELRRSYNKDGEEAYEYRFNVLCTIPLLVLDDLGAERGTDWAREKLDTIVDTRAINGLALVVTTNLGMNELPRRIASRLQRVPFGKVIYIDAPEYRLSMEK